MKHSFKQLLSYSFCFITAFTLVNHSVRASLDPSVESIEREAEREVELIVEPLIKKYCHESCKILGVKSKVKLEEAEEMAPGFDDVTPENALSYQPDSVTVNILVDELVGEVTLSNIFGIIQEHLSEFDYPVFLKEKRRKFPQPLSSTRKIAEIRSEIIHDFKTNIEDLYRDYCPKQCLLSDLEVIVSPVNLEEAQYGSTGEFFQKGDTAVRINKIAATMLFDHTLTPAEQKTILEMARLKSNNFKNVFLEAKSMKFPHPDLFNEQYGIAGYGKADRSLSSESKKNVERKSKLESQSTSLNSKKSQENIEKNKNVTTSQAFNKAEERNESYQRFEKIERVESGDAVQKELKRLSIWGLIFACSIIALLVFVAIAAFAQRSRATKGEEGGIHKILQSFTQNPFQPDKHEKSEPKTSGEKISIRYEIDRLIDELGTLFAEHPKVAKTAFSRILTDEGIEVTAAYIHIFGEGIVLDLLKDPSLQTDINELMEFYAKNEIDLDDQEKLELLKSLHNRAIASKLLVLGNRSSNLFEFLSEMDGMQIIELIQNESLTVKAIVMTQVDSQKRNYIYSQLDDRTKNKLLSELSRIDHLPKNYIFNVSNALKRKRQENPRLNTEALPGSEVLVGLLEKAPFNRQQSIIRELEISNPETARHVKSKLVSVDTLRFLRDSHLLEVVLGLKHEELLAFLKGAPEAIRQTIFDKSPRDLAAEIQDELTQVSSLNRDSYHLIERKIINRIRMMAKDGVVNLIETNERMFGELAANPSTESLPSEFTDATGRAAGW